MFASKDSLLTRPSGYNIARSVRLRSSATAYLNRTFASGNQATWTWSGWVKRGSLGSNQVLFGRQLDGNSVGYIGFTSSNTIEIINKVGPSTGAQVETSAVFRDPAAWYHIVVVYNGSGLTASAMITLYVNSVSQTYASSTRLASGNGYININLSHAIGRREVQNDNYFDGYLTEINFVDGQQLTPSSFGETDSITGVWKPKAYSGTYGTNGFELNFSDNSNNTAATIGKDYSGNGNNWTPNNISVTAGVTYDSMLDTPTPFVDGGNGRGNYAVLNPVANAGTLSDGNLTTTGGDRWSISTIGVTSGKWYAEVTVTTVGTESSVGIATRPWLSTPEQPLVGNLNSASFGYWNSGNKANNTNSAYGASYTTGDLIGIALDADAGTLTFYKNNSSQGTAFTGLTSGPYFFAVEGRTSGTPNNCSINFGQRPFTYTPPTGYVALNTYNLPASTITNGAGYMAATLYTGTGASLTVANTVGSTSFQPDWVWAKSRSAATDHALYDSVRGVQKQLESNQTGAETTETTGLTAFGSTGFTVGALAQMNTSAATYVAWQWKAGTTSVSNTNGTITSTVSAGATQGFSVVTYTGNGSSSATVGHGLGVAPSMIIVKARSGGSDWETFHTSLGSSFGIRLNTTAAKVAASSTAGGIISTSPTSTTFGFTAGTSNVNNANESGITFVAYCFAEVAGYSAFGSYTGNGSSDGPFVFLGFRPRFVMWKRTDSTASWFLEDSSRGTYNVMGPELFANNSDAEGTVNRVDFLSNGFKLRAANAGDNASGGTFIYMAFAENPFKNALAR